jgi:hypothetical protein
MKNSVTPAANSNQSSVPNARATQHEPGSATAAIDDSSIDSKAQSDRLRRAIRVSKSLLRVIEDSKNILQKLSSPFLERVAEKDAPKKSDAHRRRMRDAVFLAARDVSDPGQAIKKSIEESIALSLDLDSVLGLSAAKIKSEVVDPLESIVAQALKDANEPESATLLEQFGVKFQELAGKVDLVLDEIRALHKKLKAELKDVRIKRLVTAQTMVVAGVIVALIMIGSSSWYIRAKRTHAKTHESTSHAISMDKSTTKALTPVVMEAPSTPALGGPPPAPSTPIQKKTSQQPDTSSVRDSKFDKKQRNGSFTVAGGDDSESVKKSARAIGDAIRAWNAESDELAAREKKELRKH